MSSSEFGDSAFARTTLAQPSARTPAKRSAATYPRVADPQMAGGLVARPSLGHVNLLDVHGHVFVGAHRFDHRTHSAVDLSRDHQRAIRDYPSRDPQKRAFH